MKQKYYLDCEDSGVWLIKFNYKGESIEHSSYDYKPDAKTAMRGLNVKWIAEYEARPQIIPCNQCLVWEQRTKSDINPRAAEAGLKLKEVGECRALTPLRNKDYPFTESDHFCGFPIIHKLKIMPDPEE